MNYISVNVEHNEYFQQNYAYITDISKEKPEYGLWVAISDDDIKAVEMGEKEATVIFTYKYGGSTPTGVSISIDQPDTGDHEDEYYLDSMLADYEG